MWKLLEPKSTAAMTCPGAATCPRVVLMIGGSQIPKEEPQPQVVVALGLRITNCAPSRSSR